MIDRPYLKAKGKNAFQRNYWMCVLVAFILAWCIGSSGSSSVSGMRNSFNSLSNNSGSSYSNDDDYSDIFDDDDFDFLDELDEDHGDSGNDYTDEFLAIFGPIMITIFVVVFVLALAFMYFVKRPLSIGCRRYFVINSFEKPQFGELGFGFRKGQYLDIVKSTFMKDLFLALWSIPTYICFIGGVVYLMKNLDYTGLWGFFGFYIFGLLLLALPIYKGYEYYLVDYILSEDPHIGYKDAISQSKMMMNGYKGATFVFQLSFIGWHLLNVFTCGLLGIFWTNPYIYASEAELFLEIRGKHFGPNVQPYYIPAFPGGPGAPGGYGAAPGGYGGATGTYGKDDYGDLPPAYYPPQQFTPGQQYGSSNVDPYAQPGRPIGGPAGQMNPDPYGQPAGQMNPDSYYGQQNPDPYAQPSAPAPTERKIQMPSSKNSEPASDSSSQPSEPASDPYSQPSEPASDPYGMPAASTTDSSSQSSSLGSADSYTTQGGLDSSDYYSADQILENDPYADNNSAGTLENNDPFGTNNNPYDNGNNNPYGE